MRLEMSLRHARARDAELPITAMMHYPPLTDEHPGFSDLLERYGVSDCVYGHLHGAAILGGVRGLRNGVRYHQVSCDGLGFKLYLLYGEQAREGESSTGDCAGMGPRVEIGV